MSTTRNSPPTTRVIAVLDHLADHPGERFGVSELARAVGLSKPTCLGIVTALAEHGYLAVDPAAKTYGLGPALVRVGHSAAVAFGAAETAAALLGPLAAEFGTTVSASAVVGTQIELLATAGEHAPKPGRRYPFAPPVGLMYVLWDRDEAVTDWLKRPPTLPMTVDRRRLRKLVSECRERGYLVEGMSATGRKLHTLLAGVAAYDLPAEVRELVGEVASDLGERVYLEAELSGRGRLPVSLIAAPTYDSQGKQELVLTMDVAATVSRAEIKRLGNAIVTVADAVTAGVGGQTPEWKVRA